MTRVKAIDGLDRWLVARSVGFELSFTIGFLVVCAAFSK